MQRFMIVVLFFFFLPSSCVADIKDLRTVQTIQSQVMAWQEAGKIDNRTAKVLCDDLFYQASKIVGKPIHNNNDLILAIQKQEESYVTFWNAVMFFSALIGMVGLGWIAKMHILGVLHYVNPSIYEIVGYLFIAGGLVSGIPGFYITASLCMLPLMLASRQIHLKNKVPGLVVWIATCLLWGLIAIHYESHIMTILATIVLIISLAFCDLLTPVIVSIFQEDGIIARIMSAGGLVMLGGLILPLNIFTPSLLWVGIITYYFGCLIVSGKWYCVSLDEEDRTVNLNNFFIIQTLVIVSLIMAFTFGTIYDIIQLKKAVGTFSALYLIVKYAETPWNIKTFAWSLVGVAITLYLVSYLAIYNPEYFLFGG